MDVMTMFVLVLSGAYMYWTFADLFSRGLMLTCVVGVIFMLVIQTESMLLRHKRRIANMIEAPAQEFTS